jgi:hypothetical protein
MGASKVSRCVLDKTRHGTWMYCRSGRLNSNTFFHVPNFFDESIEKNTCTSTANLHLKSGRSNIAPGVTIGNNARIDGSIVGLRSVVGMANVVKGVNYLHVLICMFRFSRNKRGLRLLQGLIAL